MNTLLPQRVTLLTALIGLAGFVMLAGLILFGYRAAIGRPLSLKQLVKDQLIGLKNLPKILSSAGRIRQQSTGAYTNVIFLHHSVGQGLIANGDMRGRLRAAGFNLWDQGYSWDGLTGPDGTPTGFSYLIPEENTDPDGLAYLFAQPELSLPLNGYSQLLQHEVIVFKSCFPVSHVPDDTVLARYQKYYLTIRAEADAHPDRLFIILTPPPLNPAETNPAGAAGGRRWAKWLMSEEFLGSRSNLRAFDLFDTLAEADPARPDFNMLRASYRQGTDSHPTQPGSRAAGAAVADFIAQAVQDFRVYRSQTQRLEASQ